MSPMENFVKVLAVLIATASCEPATTLWVWKCNESGFCERNISGAESETAYPTPELCRLVCEKNGPLWPKPQQTSLNSELIHFSVTDIRLSELNCHPTVEKHVVEIIEIFNGHVSNTFLGLCSESHPINISISVVSSSLDLTWETDESYTLTTTNSSNGGLLISIEAQTVYGARHGLETLSQLVEVYKRSNDICLVTLTQVSIKDAPAYPHRGLLLDSTRNFLTLSNLKTHINAMAASKLNVLHWHVTDSQSFPLETPSVPNMTRYGAYSKEKIYSPLQVADLFYYAKIRGVRIIIEIDAPAHTAYGWQWGSEAGLGNLAVCINKQPWTSYCVEPPCGQLNPVNENVFQILEKLYSDVQNYQPKGEVFHIGGDEINFNCWNTTQEIIDHFGDTPRTKEALLDMWGEWQKKALQAFDKAAGNEETPIILWSSDLTDPAVIEKYLPKNRYVIQPWVFGQSDLPEELLKLGYRLIITSENAWYLDHGTFGPYPYHPWTEMYGMKLPPPSLNGTLGGEACLFGEFVDSSSTEAKAWPRAAVVGERLWTNPDNLEADTAVRFYRHRVRLVQRGVKAEVPVPEWCYHNERQCLVTTGNTEAPSGATNVFIEGYKILIFFLIPYLMVRL